MTVKVPLYGSPMRAVQLDERATEGAVFGKNLFWPDGSVVTLAQLGGGSNGSTGGPDTTDALDEGQWNLYFTTRRAQDAVGGILADSANVSLSYAGGTSITADLIDQADSGVGAALVKITRDTKGRISGTSAATTDDLAEGAGNLYYTDARADGRITAQKGLANGLAPLGGDGKINIAFLPAAVLGQVSYQGTWDASAGTPPTSAPQKGWYYIVTVAGSTNLGGITDWNVGDWAIYDVAWHKVDNTDAISTWNGRTGAVVPQAGDYTPAMVGAEPAITAGTAAQYWRGDKTWRDFATDVRAAVLTGLSTATNAVIAATDTVLGALGKLQAQITNLLPLDGSKTMTGTLNIRATGLQINMGVDHSTIAIGPIQSAASDGNLVNENISCSDTVAFAPRHNFYRGRGTNAVPSDVFNGDTLGGIQMIARVGGAWQNSASILSTVDGAPGASFAPGMLQFSTSDGLSGVTLRWFMRAAGHLQPAADNVYDVGSASTRTRVIYAGTGSINTSDARDKTSVTPLSEPELAASIALSREIGTYQWLSSVQAKGAEARWHAGLTVQRAIEILQAHGLDPFRYGFICYDQWDEQPEIVSSWPAKEAVLDEEGNVVEPAVEAGSEVVQPYRAAGDRYSFRHDQLLLFIARGIDARLTALETGASA